MSIATEISRLQTAKSDLKTSINTKLGSGTLIDTENIDDYSGFVDNILTQKEEETKTFSLSMASGNQVITPTTDKVMTQVTVTKPATLIPHNIKTGTFIGGVIGNLNTAEQIAEGNTGLDILLDSSVTSLRNHAFTDMELAYLTLEYNGVVSRKYANCFGSNRLSNISARAIKIFVPYSQLANYKANTTWSAFGTSIFGFADLTVGDTFDISYSWYSDKALTTSVSGTASATARYYCSISDTSMSRYIYKFWASGFQDSDTYYGFNNNAAIYHYFPFYNSGGNVFYNITLYYSSSSSESSTTVTGYLTLGSPLRIEHPDTSSCYIDVLFNLNGIIYISGNPGYTSSFTGKAITGFKINSLGQTW